MLNGLIKLYLELTYVCIHYVCVTTITIEKGHGFDGAGHEKGVRRRRETVNKALMDETIIKIVLK